MQVHLSLDGFRAGRMVEVMLPRATTIETLPEDLRKTVEMQVRRGDHANADEAIRQAILSHEEHLELRRSLMAADAAINRGDFVTPEGSRARSSELLASLKKRDA
jgi:Arc/MetJ-type ribon-helix-helix transcriptional regulator